MCLKPSAILLKICLLSDTHSYLDDQIITQLKWSDEIWHAGDIGNEETLNKMVAIRPFRGVSGNIDGADIRIRIPEVNHFEVNGLRVLIYHIGGYPPKYNTVSRSLIQRFKPDLFISGHSHILKIMRDKNTGALHMNPGAAGQHGFHIQRTLIRFQIDGSKIVQPEVVELGRRGKLVVP